jgi:hypothetical protein
MERFYYYKNLINFQIGGSAPDTPSNMLSAEDIKRLERAALPFDDTKKK